MKVINSLWPPLHINAEAHQENTSTGVTEEVVAQTPTTRMATACAQKTNAQSTHPDNSITQ